MHKEIESDLCPGCGGGIEVEYYYEDSSLDNFDHLTFQCGRCNYISEATLEHKWIAIELEKGKAIFKLTAISDVVREFDVLMPCPPKVSPEYCLPDGSQWIRRIMPLTDNMALRDKWAAMQNEDGANNNTDKENGQ